MLVPLGVLDNHLEEIGTCLAFVVQAGENWTVEDKAAFVERLEGATERVVRKWTLLQGLPKKLENGSWAIDVPDEPPTDRKLYDLTTATTPKPYHVVAGASSPLPPLSSASSGYLPNPLPSLFRSPTSPITNTDYAKKRLPLLHVHVTVLADAFAVGVSVPHGLFDGGGTGLVVRALDAELHGRPWPFEIPPLFSLVEGNPMTRILDSLVDDPAVPQDEVVLPARWLPWQTSKVLHLLGFLLTLVVERLWWKSEGRCIFLRRKAVDVLVERAKQEVKATNGGSEYVSEADVVGAWLFQSAHQNEASTNGEVASSILMSLRPLLAEYATQTGLSAYPFDQYPFNTSLPFDIFPASLGAPVSDFVSTPLAEAALLFRRGLLAHRSTSMVKTIWARVREMSTFEWQLHWMREWADLPTFLRRLFPFLPGARDPPRTRWIVSNQCFLGIGDLHFPSPRKEDDGKDLPLVAFHMFSVLAFEQINTFNLQAPPDRVGVTVIAFMRRSRWASFDKALEELERRAVEAE
ncbi:hypothetical protein JCM8097_008148 [Rhodosporidiobolus ruineniae]